MKLLTVDLNTYSAHDQILGDAYTEFFVGGRGINTKLLYDLTSPHVEPYSADCPVIFGTGPLTGTPFPMAGRFVATSKSPQTGTITTSACGGRMGVYLKKAGFDFLLIKGISKNWSYISIINDDIKIHDGTDLCGRSKNDIKRILREKHGKNISILLIGTAAENGVLYANIENDGNFFGRGGLGALLGSKKIKAIVTQGNKKIRPQNKEDFSFVAYECKKWLASNPITSQGLPQFGTGILLNFMRETGLLTTKNFSMNAPFESSRVSGEELTAKLLKKRHACLFCPVACGRITAIGKGPEYESLWALGVNIGIFDIEKVAHLNNLCNELGLDTVSTGSSIGMAMELSEMGVFPFTIEYGNFDSIYNVILDIAARKGAGEIIGLGTKKLALQYGAESIAPQVKGLEFPAYDPRGAYGHALGYATSNRGGCHMQGYLIGAEILGIPKLIDRFAVQGKASLLALYQNVSAFMDTLVMCRFSSFAIPHDYYARIASSVTGKKITWEDSIRTGERIWNLERLFNLREGVEKDCLPERFKEIPIAKLLEEYYEIREWNTSGVPTKKILMKLGLL